MAISIYPVTPDFAAEIGDVDLAMPLSSENRDAIKAAFWQHAVLVFPAQTLNPEQHLAFARVFGPLEAGINAYADDIGRDRIDNRVSDISNLDADGNILPFESRKRQSGIANRLWHTDSSFRHVSALASLLYSRQIAPVGGHTQFTDMRAAWDALPVTMKRRIDGLEVEHSIFHSRASLGFTEYSERERASLPGAVQMLVRTIPESGRRSLYLASHACRIVGMPDADATQLIAELMAHATQRQFVHTHRWRTGDLVMWDNRCTMHRGTEYDEGRWKREMHRAIVSDIGNTREAVS